MNNIEITPNEELIKFAANILQNFFPDEPCNYNDMDEYTDCTWCEEHCQNHSIRTCWEHAIKEGWYKRRLV